MSTSHHPQEHDILALAERLRRWVGSGPRRAEGSQILHLLGEVPAASLDPVLTEVGVHQLVRSLRDRVAGPDQRTALLEFLCKERLEHLGTTIRAGLVRALQAGFTGAFAEKSIRDVLVSTRGEALTDLKNLIDASGEAHDLQHLVFSDIDDIAVRDEILAHIAAEARSLERRELKVLSDVDDTFYANWKDDRYPGKTVYPGVLQFYQELHAGPDAEPRRHGGVVFVTARPGGLGIIERQTLRSLRKRGIANPTVLSGSLARIFGTESIASKKLDNFSQFAALFPEYDFVFAGDSGQGDVRFGTRILERWPDRVRAVFIHDVVATPPRRRAAHRDERVFFFDTYAGAALEAFQLSLVSADGVQRVIDAARAELARIRFRNQQLSAARNADLDRDCAAAAALLRGAVP